MEGIPEINLNTHVEELMVLYETIVNFKSLKDNSLDFFGTMEFQGWNAFFKRLTGPVDPILVKQL